MSWYLIVLNVLMNELNERKCLIIADIPLLEKPKLEVVEPTRNVNHLLQSHLWLNSVERIESSSNSTIVASAQWNFIYQPAYFSLNAYPILELFIQLSSEFVSLQHFQCLFCGLGNSSKTTCCLPINLRHLIQFSVRDLRCITFHSLDHKLIIKSLFGELNKKRCFILFSCLFFFWFNWYELFFKFVAGSRTFVEFLESFVSERFRSRRAANYEQPIQSLLQLTASKLSASLLADVRAELEVYHELVSGSIYLS